MAKHRYAVAYRQHIPYIRSNGAKFLSYSIEYLILIARNVARQDIIRKLSPQTAICIKSNLDMAISPDVRLKNHLAVMTQVTTSFTYPTLSQFRTSACCLASNKFRSLLLCTSLFQSVASQTTPYSPSPTMKSPRTWPNFRNMLRLHMMKCKNTYQPTGPVSQDESSDGMPA